MKKDEYEKFIQEAMEKYPDLAEEISEIDRDTQRLVDEDILRTQTQQPVGPTPKGWGPQRSIESIYDGANEKIIDRALKTYPEKASQETFRENFDKPDQQQTIEVKPDPKHQEKDLSASQQYMLGLKSQQLEKQDATSRTEKIQEFKENKEDVSSKQPEQMSMSTRFNMSLKQNTLEQEKHDIDPKGKTEIDIDRDRD